ncbi:hypothetical protein D1007_10092 [Hordeum vulgare]|nr:hypothetical protein D1007_10092 [Hordeum vulgare]
MARLPSISDIEWGADVQHREAVTADRQRRLDARRIRDAAAAATAALELDQEEARAGMMNLPGLNPQAAWRCRQGASVALSPMMPPWGYMSSPGYSDGDAHGGFNPNTAFRSFPTGFGHNPHTPSPSFSVGIITWCSYSPPATRYTMPRRRMGGGRDGGDGTGTNAKAGKEEKAGSKRQANRAMRQVDVKGRRVPCRSVENC